MKQEEVSFFIEEIDSSRSKSFQDGIRIYLDTTPRSIQTSPDEIGHWLDEYSQKHPGDLFKVLLLHRREGRNSEVIGYLQFAFISKPGIVFVDYICIRKGERGHRAFGCFLERFESYLESEGLAYRYIVAEVNGAEELAPDGKRAMAMVRLLESEGLISPHVPYFHPSLDHAARGAPAESPFSLLVISARCDIEGIGRNEYLEIVDTLYYMHYYRWYAGIYPECAEKYKKHLDRLLAKTRLLLSGSPEVLPVGGCAQRPSSGKVADSSAPGYVTSVVLGTLLALIATAVVKYLYPDVAAWLAVFLMAFIVSVPLAMATRNESAIITMASRALDALLHRKQQKASTGNRKNHRKNRIEEPEA